LLVQVPPDVASVNVADEPEHNVVVPDIAAGSALMVIIVVTRQPALYDIVAVPALTPVTIPLAEPIVARPVLLAQVPPVNESVSVIVEPTQTAAGPPMAEGSGTTVSVVVT